MSRLAPITLGPNYADQAYRGGGRSARFRGLDPAAAPSPEDWIASVTSRWHQDPDGMTRLGDGRLLKEAVEADPEGYLGPEHLAAYGADPGLLVKLLDAAERLVVHCHPDRAFARTHLGCAHGKTEAWVVLEAREGAQVHLGFRREVAREELDAWVADQDVDAMLEALHHLPVGEGTAVLVPPASRMRSATGSSSSSFQEPTDFSVMLEQGGFTGGDLGLGFEVALGCVDRSAWDPDRVARLAGPGLSGDGAVLPAAAEPFFRAESLSAASGTPIEAGYAVLVARSGSGQLHGGLARWPGADDPGLHGARPPRSRSPPSDR